MSRGKFHFEPVDDPIESGDLVYGIHTKEIARCLAVFDDGDIIIMFLSGSSRGMRACLSVKCFKKAKRVKEIKK